MRIAGVVSLVTLTCLLVTAWAASDAGREPRVRRADAQVPATPHFRFFAASSFWNEPQPSHRALAAHSGRTIAAFDRQIAAETRAGRGPTINITAYSVPIYTVPAGTPTVPVTLQSASFAPGLRAAWSAVPLPPYAEPAAGSDGHLVVWQPSSDRLWEFWRLARSPSGWRAWWGGGIEDVSHSPGVYGPGAWRGATSSWGASASSLSIVGGLITLEDLAHARIEHALAIGIPHVRAGVYASPARRTDGNDAAALALPEGARLVLDPGLDLSKLHLPPLTLTLAEAAQRYGIVVRDRAARVSFYAQDPTPTGTDPYSGAAGYLEGQTPSQVLRSFPWRHLRLARMVLHRARSAPRP